MSSPVQSRNAVAEEAVAKARFTEPNVRESADIVDRGQGGSHIQQTVQNLSYSPTVEDAPDAGLELRQINLQTQHEWQGRLIDGVIETSITNQKDALNLLYRAAEHQESAQAGRIPGDDQLRILHSPVIDTAGRRSVSEPDSSLPAVSTEEWHNLRHRLCDPEQQVLDAWRDCPFVVQRWMTAREAITWVDLFFQNMAALSPIMDDFYQDHHNHHVLVTEEPLLCSTILMLSCRYHLLVGDGGLSRGYFLHERLWKHCQSLFNQLWWGEERRLKPRLRTVGAIQSFLLLAEWHPRSFHLTFEHDTWNTALQEPAGLSQVQSTWLEGVIEPVRKSNRMSWMLLGSAVTLAHEVGLFGSSTSRVAADVSSSKEHEQNERLKRLLFIFISNTTSRLGCQVPKTPLFHISILSMLNDSSWTEHHEWKELMTLWIDLTRIVKSSSEIIFPSESVTKEILQTGRYCDLLEHFGHILDKWWDQYPKNPGLSVRYDVLFIQYQYVRIYINALAMQAIAARRKDGHNPADFTQPEIHPQDYVYLRQVIEGCKLVLEMTLKHNDSGHLKYLPVRVHIQIASTAIYLIKALALGVGTDDRDCLLDLLDCTAKRLRSSTVDDIYLAVQFASLLEIHVQVLRRRSVQESDIGAAQQQSQSASLSTRETVANAEISMDPSAWRDDWLASRHSTPFLDLFDGFVGQNPFEFNADGYSSFWNYNPLPEQ